MNSSEILADKIHKYFSKNSNIALFAGAGIGAQCGLPTWREYLIHLAEVAGRFDTHTENYMKIQIDKERYLLAANIYKNCLDIPTGTKYSELAAPFLNPPYPERIDALTSLPFSVFVTTNYDRSLHISLASVVGKDYIALEFGDPLMKQATYLKENYIARIHGRAEVPETMILDKDDYSRTREDLYYEDYLIHLFTKFNCIFIGFSFIDPAINRIFQVVEERLSPNFPKDHIALLSNTSDATLFDKLSKWNVQTFTFNPRNSHYELWEAVKIASRKFKEHDKVSKPKPNIPLEPIHRYLATSYAQAKLSDELRPLREIIIDGILVDILSSEEKKRLSRISLAESLRQILKLNKEDSNTITKKRTEYLASKGICYIDKNDIVLQVAVENPLQEDYQIILKGIENRLLVRHGITFSENLELQIRNCIEEILISRGWDLGASYFGNTSQNINLQQTIASSVLKFAPEYPQSFHNILILSIYDLFQHPSKIESAVLSRLGRISFALQLVFNSPTATITHSDILPEKIYLDSNYVMRAILDGHPLHPVFYDSLSTLVNASSKAGKKAQLLVPNVFLGEIIKHRQLALREVDELGLNNINKLKDFISYYGAESVNVFIGAFSGWNDRLTKKPITFKEFLYKVAPYDNEDKLKNYLENKIGLRVINIQTQDCGHLSFRKTVASLELAYESDYGWQGDKNIVLIRNEAKQLYALLCDYENNIRTIFVSGDRRLRRLSKGEDLGVAGLSMLSNRGFIQMVDMVIGVESESDSISRLLWATGLTDEESQLIMHFTNIALREYHDAMAKALPEVLESFIPKVRDQAEKENIKLIMPNLEQRSRNAEFLDRFQDDFYEEMRKAVEKLESNE